MHDDSAKPEPAAPPLDDQSVSTVAGGAGETKPKPVEPGGGSFGGGGASGSW